MQVVGTDFRMIKGVSKEDIYALWSNVNDWASWNSDIESAKLEGAFEEGSYFTMVLVGGQKVRIQLFKIESNKMFTDVTTFPLAKMYGIHEIIEKEDELELRATIKIEGLLSFVWKKLVANKIANKLGEDMDRLIQVAKSRHE